MRTARGRTPRHVKYLGVHAINYLGAVNRKVEPHTFILSFVLTFSHSFVYSFFASFFHSFFLSFLPFSWRSRHKADACAIMYNRRTPPQFSSSFLSFFFSFSLRTGEPLRFSTGDPLLFSFFLFFSFFCSFFIFYSCIRSFFCSFIHPFTPSPILSCTHSFVHSFFLSSIHTFFPSFILSFFHSFILSFVLTFFHTFVYSFLHSFLLLFLPFIWRSGHNTNACAIMYNRRKPSAVFSLFFSFIFFLLSFLSLFLFLSVHSCTIG